MAEIWIDFIEIKGGDSLLKKIADAITSVDYVIAVLTKRSVASKWVKTELEIAMTKEINQKKIVVIPVVREECEIPSFISHKHYINFVNNEFKKAIVELKEAIAPAEVTHESVVIKAGLIEPTGVAILKNKIFVSDHSTGTISRYNMFGRHEKEKAALYQPHHITIQDENLYVCDTSNNRIIIYDYELNQLQYISHPKLSRPHGIAIMEKNKLLIANADRHSILFISKNKAKEYFSTLDGESFHFPCGIYSHDERIYVVDTFNHRILVMSKNLEKITSFGSKGTGDNQFICPVALLFIDNFILISDETNKRLQLWEEVKRDVFKWRKSNIMPIIKSPFGLATDNKHVFIADRMGGNLSIMEWGNVIF